MTGAFPFLRPTPDIMRCGPWAMEVVNGTAELPADLPTWDYDTTLALRRNIVVDGARARSESGLEADSELALSACWLASDSLLRGRSWQAPVPAADGHAVSVAFDLPGDQLGGALELRMILTLVDAGSSTSRIAARRPGSVLWSDTFTAGLRGSAAHFPIALADFNELPYPTDAAWLLQVGDDLHAAALGSLLLVINEAKALLVDALAGAAAPDPEASIVLQVLRADLIRALVERAATDESFDAEQTYPPGSTGALLAAVLRDHLPTLDLESVRREREHEPGLLGGRLQAAARLFEAAR